MMKTQKAYINTLGCQMNVYDTTRMENMLTAAGYEFTDSFWRADLVIINTCAIREKAVQKVYSFLGRICGIKRRRPSMTIAVTGCVAQQQSKWIAERFEGIDLILGTHAVLSLTRYLEKLSPKDGTRVDTPLIDVAMTSEIDTSPAETPSIEKADISSFVTIMRGCDNFCTYCVVPYVRGREISRPPQRIQAEVEALVNAGAREVTLLGQNVNSYGQKEGLCTFPQLLERIHDIEDLLRIRFVTSHPKDLSDELIDAFARLPKLANHIHLPVQSGSDRVLARMNRKYTRDHYMQRVARLREARPGIAVTTDFIAGFPGETRSDFEDTLDLIRQVGFDMLFAFEYSDRPDAPAARFDEKVDNPEKKRRLQEIFDVQKNITARIYQDLAGTTQTVLVEGKSKKPRQDVTEMSGRSSENRIVNFIDPDRRIADGDPPAGQLADVVIEKACANSLWGRIAPEDRHRKTDASMQIKGGKTNAA